MHGTTIKKIQDQLFS